MAAGGPGDHPLTDILNFKLPVYSPEADETIRRLEQLMGRQRLSDWFDQNRLWNTQADGVLKIAAETLDRELARAKAAGWEIPQS